MNLTSILSGLVGTTVMTPLLLWLHRAFVLKPRELVVKIAHDKAISDAITAALQTIVPPIVNGLESEATLLLEKAKTAVNNSLAAKKL